MAPIPTLTFLTAACLTGMATVLLVVAVERLRARRVLAAAFARPASVERAWLSAPDESGQRSLFVKPVGGARASSVASDFEVDDVVRRFSQAGIRIGYEHDDAAV